MVYLDSFFRNHIEFGETSIYIFVLADIQFRIISSKLIVMYVYDTSKDAVQ